jgi:WD40 repeat protein
MTDRELEKRLRAWYAAQVGESETAPEDLRASVAAIPATARAPLRPLGRSRRFNVLAVAAVLIVGGSLAASSGLLRLTSVVPPPAQSDPLLVTPAPEPSATPRSTANLRPGSLVAFARWAGPVSRIWVSGEGGRDARELLPGGMGDQYGRLAWSPDGSRLLYSEGGDLFLTDVNGSDPLLLDTGCVAPCDRDTDAAFSSDGTKIVFARQSLDADGQVESAAIATLDLASGRVALLASTASDSAWWPSWSPDGQRIVFSRYGEGDINALFVVDPDGGNLHQISPPTLAAGYGEWSPDGSRIVFWTPDFASTGINSGRGPRVKDIYTIRPDGTDLRRLTSDGLSSAASWTADGRILFAKKNVDAGGPNGVSFWTMDADGTDATMLVPVDITGILDDEFPPVRAVPQPLGGPAIAANPRPGAPAIAVGPTPPTPTPPELGPRFSWTGSMDAEFSPLGVTATLLADGRVLFVGSCDTLAQLYDPRTGTFSPTGSLTVVRGGMSATLLRDGRVLVAGGYACASGDATWASAELYDPTTGTFSPTGSMAAPRSQHTATLLADGRVLIAGGLTGSSARAGGITLASYRTAAVDSFLATAEIYDPTTGTFSRTGSMSSPHRGHTATLLRDGRVLVVGNGGESSPAGNVADVYEPTTGRFTRTGSMKTGRSDHTATLLEDGRVLILGGDTGEDPASVSGELYDPATGSFSAAGSMADGRSHHTATRLPDGRVLIVGGFWNDGQNAGVLSSAELYDPGTGIFSPIGSIGTPREGHHTTLLQDGRVLIAGGAEIGRRGAVAVPSALLYQP